MDTLGVPDVTHMINYPTPRFRTASDEKLGRDLGMRLLDASIRSCLITSGCTRLLCMHTTIKIVIIHPFQFAHVLKPVSLQ